MKIADEKNWVKNRRKQIEHYDKKTYMWIQFILEIYVSVHIMVKTWIVKYFHNKCSYKDYTKTCKKLKSKELKFAF